MLHRSFRLLFVLLACLTPQQTFAEPQRIPRVRAVDTVTINLINRGHRRSPKFRELIETIEASDVIAHIEWQHSDNLRPRGATRIAAFAGGYRYVRITLAGMPRIDVLVGLLGHELQHVAEIAQVSWVTDARTCEHLYRRIGSESCGVARQCFETIAAQRVEAQVLEELRREDALHGTFVSE